MAVKKCDDIVEETTATEENGENTSARKRRTFPKGARQVQAQISLGKTIEIVEKNVYDNLVSEGDIPLLETGIFNILDTFGNGYIRKIRAQDIADPLRAELRTFFATDENGQMSYLSNRLDGSAWWLLHSTQTYGVSPIGIEAYNEPQEITGDTFSKFEQDFKVFTKYFIENNDGPTYSDYTVLSNAWGVFVDGGTDAATGLSRPSPLIDTTSTFTDHYTNIVTPFTQEELDKYANILNNPFYGDVEPLYNFYIPGYESLISADTTKEYQIENLYSELTKDNNTLQQQLSKLGTGVQYINNLSKLTTSNKGYDITSKFRNIAFPSSQVQALLDGKDIDNLYPMYNTLEMKTDQTGHFLRAAETAGMTDELTKLIMNESIAFGGNVAPASAFNALEFAISAESIVISDTGYKYKTDITKQKVPLIDLESWLETYFDENKTYTLDSNFNLETIFLGVPVNESEESGTCSKFTNTLLSLILAGKINQIVEDNFRTYEEMLQGVEAYNETLVYEIRKKSVNSSATQTIFVPNTELLDVLTYIDTQVKYDKEYTYQVYAQQLIVGTEYSYSSTRARSYTRSTNEHSTNYTVSYKPSLKIAQIPIFVEEATILDNAPVPPNVDIIPYKGVSDQLLINLSSNVGDYELQPIIIDQRDKKYVAKFKKTRKLLPNEPIRFRSDDFVQKFEIYRLEDPPMSYDDFDGNLLTTETNNVAISVSFVDDISPNKKYYYTFRGIDVHNNRSNPTDVYQVELVQFEGMIFFDINIYNFKFEEMGYNNVKSSRTFRRYLKVNPNLIQSLIDYDKSIPTKSTASARDATRVELGLADESVWDKRFKMRITSKHSGKKFDINFTCKVIRKLNPQAKNKITRSNK